MGEEVTSKDVHKLRTSIRRIEVALEPAGKFSGSKKLQRHLDTMRRMAGRVRDIDVQIDLLRGLHVEDYGNDCVELQNVLQRRRAKQEKKTGARVAKEIGKGLEARLQDAAKVLEELPRTRRVANQERVEQLRQQFIELTREVPQDGDPLHALRKASKRLRYRLEAIAGRESRSLEKDMKGVQDAIGAWHDWATLTAEGEKRLAPKSIAFVSYLKSLTIAKRHEARRAVIALRDKLTHARAGKKPPARATHDRTTHHQAAR